MRVRAFLTAIAVAAGSIAATPASAAPIPPPGDPFYQPPAGYELTAPGTILRTRSVNLAAFAYLPQKVHSWQLLYRTTDRHGNAMATVTTVLLPWNARPSALLSYQVAQDSTAPQCVPSFMLQQGASNEGIVTQAEILLIDAAVQQGWAVSVPDHEGPSGHLGVAKEPGYAALDGIRAATRFTPLGLDANVPVGLWGYSGGGLASGWTAEMQPSYAPEVNIRGAALGGPVPNLGALVERVNGGPFAGLVPLGIASLRKAYPQVDNVVNTYMKPSGKAIMDKANTMCTAETAARNAFLDLNKHTTIPLDQLVRLPELQEVFEDVKLGKNTPTAPLYVYQAVNDEIVSVSDVDKQVAKYCATGGSVTYKRDVLSEHVSLVITGAADALNWLKKRLNNSPMPTGCNTATVASTLLSPSALATFGMCCCTICSPCSAGRSDRAPSDSGFGPRERDAHEGHVPTAWPSRPPRPSRRYPRPTGAGDHRRRSPAASSTGPADLPKPC